MNAHVQYSGKIHKALANQVAGVLDSKGFSATVTETYKTEPGVVSVQLGSSAASHAPLIFSAPPMLQDGDIKGSNFGQPGVLFTSTPR